MQKSCVRSLLKKFLIAIVIFNLNNVTGRKVTDSDEFPENVIVPFVNTTKGVVRGSVIVTDKGNWGYSFQRIPYAAPPVGSLRFKSPQPVNAWSGVLDGTDWGPCCWQLYSLFDEQRNRTSSEDCLTLNVYTPLKNNETSGYPVVLYYIGGAWQNNDPGRYPIEPLIDNYGSRGVIMIMIGYRANVFGGFTNGGKDYPGNIALRDYIAGLQWIQQEIKAFGGDPNRVTIQGESSGGQGVSLMTLSPAAQGLFHQAIPMSGSAATAGAAANGSQVVAASEEFANLMGCNDFNQWRWAPERVFSCLQKIEPKQLFISFLMSGKTEIQTPRIDGPGGIIPEDPVKQLDNRRPYPLLTGTLTKEAVFFFGVGGAPIDDAIQMFNSQTAEMICEMLGNASVGAETEVADACKEYYNLTQLKQDHPDSDSMFWFEKCIDLIDALSFFAPSFNEADSMRKTKKYPVYLYSFEYVKKGSEGLAPWHGLDLWHLLGFPLPVNESDLSFKTPEDTRIDDIYSTVFCNFVKFGNPTPPSQNNTIGNVEDGNNDTLPTWEPLASPIGFNYFTIDLQPQNKDFYHYSDLLFWNEIVPYLTESVKNSKKKNKWKWPFNNNYQSQTHQHMAETRSNDIIDIKSAIYDQIIGQMFESQNLKSQTSDNLDAEQVLRWENEQELKQLIPNSQDSQLQLGRLELITKQLLKHFDGDSKMQSFIQSTSTKIRNSLSKSSHPSGVNSQQIAAPNIINDAGAQSSPKVTSFSAGAIAIIAFVSMISVFVATVAAAMGIKKRRAYKNRSEYSEITSILPKNR